MNNDWIEWTWTEEKPYPETLETKVYILLKDDEEGDLGVMYPVREWIWHPSGGITHYKLA